MDKSTPSKESLERARKFLDEQLELRSPMHSWLESLALEFDTIRRERDEVTEKLAEALETCLSLLGNLRKDGYAGDYLTMLDMVLDGDEKDESLERTALAAYRERIGR